MNIEQLCTSLELATKLRDLGYPQGGNLFWWVKAHKGWEMNGKEYYIGIGARGHCDVICAAPTAGELGEFMPIFIDEDKDYWLVIEKELNAFIVTYKCSNGNIYNEDLYVEDILMVNAMSKMAIHLLESGKGKGRK